MKEYVEAKKMLVRDADDDYKGKIRESLETHDYRDRDNAYDRKRKRREEIYRDGFRRKKRASFE